MASNVKGDINITPQGCKDGFQSQVVGPDEDGFVVKEGDVIETGSKSRIKLSNAETGSYLMLGSGSKLTITNDLCFGVSELPIHEDYKWSGKFRALVEEIVDVVHGPCSGYPHGKCVTAVNVRG